MGQGASGLLGAERGESSFCEFIKKYYYLNEELFSSHEHRIFSQYALVDHLLTASMALSIRGRGSGRSRWKRALAGPAAHR